MREDLLHFVWKYQKLPGQHFKSAKGEKISIHNAGMHNHGAGPDFFNAQLEIEGQLWAGNVEMHIKASDWYAHGHETDPNYDNVILHVVWEDDVDVFRKDNTAITTLELKHLMPKPILDSYEKLLHGNKKKFINCAQNFSSINGVVLNSWLERLYVDRLEQKSRLIFELLKTSKNDWEKVLFCLLMKNFGLNKNGEIFLALASKLDFGIIRKVRHHLLGLESLLFGSAGLLDDKDCADVYFLELKKEFDFLKNKFQLAATHTVRPAFFGLRPNNFPTVRLSQIANLYHEHSNIFAEIINIKNKDDLQRIFQVTASNYWDDHYTFGKKSKHRKKKLTNAFIDLLIINTLVPLKFCYAKYSGKENAEELIQLMSQLKAEKNSIITKFDAIGPKTDNAMATQSKLQLYREYCSKNNCLRCAVGTSLLNRNV